MNDDIQRNATGIVAVSHQFFCATQAAPDATPATDLLQHTGTSIHPSISASHGKDKHSMDASVTSLSLHRHVA